MESNQRSTLTLQHAEDFTRVAFAGIDRQWPYKTGHVYLSENDVVAPRINHPVFYGHFDWHSSVHGHWTLVRLLRMHPGHSRAAEVRSTLQRRLTREACASEAAFLKKNPSFERMYGWAWAMRLGAELRSWDDADARKWAECFRPIEDVIEALFLAYLPKLDWPVRCGFHPETAFALGQFHDWAKVAKSERVSRMVEDKALAFYEYDRAYPVNYEPSGQDFFSPCLNVADLMRRVMARSTFLSWLDEYLPGLRNGEAGNILHPAKVSDLSDGQIVHLVGLNLSRAWTMKGIASVMDTTDARRVALETSANAHATAGLKDAVSGHYEGDHWLASFAVYLLSAVGIDG
jgi:Protein of unknown function (DUF2891)